MRPVFPTLMLICALLAPGAAGCAGIASASFQASLTVSDACRIDTATRAPVVRCLLASPSQIAPRAQAFAASAAGPLWTITF